jgi:hypothetical protein
MPVEYLSAEQESRYGRFATEPSPGELEQFFRLDTRALELARAKRRPATRLGWAVQWGTVRMLGTFLTEDPTAVPAAVVRFVAEQLGLGDEHFAEYGTRVQTVYEHAWEIRDAYGYRDFAAGEAELREFLAARVWSSLEGPRALFDRAVVWLVNNRVLLPGVTTLARMVAALRQEENDRLHAALYDAVPYDLRTRTVASSVAVCRVTSSRFNVGAFEVSPNAPTSRWSSPEATAATRSCAASPCWPPGSSSGRSSPACRRTRVRETIPAFHPVWADVDTALIDAIDKQAAHGSFRNWANITAHILSGMKKLNLKQVDEDLVRWVYSKIGGM